MLCFRVVLKTCMQVYLMACFVLRFLVTGLKCASEWLVSTLSGNIGKLIPGGGRDGTKRNTSWNQTTSCFFSCWLLPIYLALWWRYLIASAGYPKLWNQFPNIIHTISFHFVLYWAYNMNFRKSTRYLSTWAIKKTTLSHLSILVG